MKFPRNVRIFRGHFEVAPFAGLFFVLLMFLMLQQSLVFTPGVRIQLPTAAGLAGPSGPTFAVAVGENGQLFFQNRLVNETELKTRLSEARTKAGARLTLVIQADRKVSNEVLIRLFTLAHEVDVREAWLAARPQLFSAPPATAPSAR